MPVHGTHNAVQDDRNEKILIYVNGELFPRNDIWNQKFFAQYIKCKFDNLGATYARTRNP